MLIVLRIFIAAGLITFASWLSGRRPALAGFVMALPLSLVFFIPFVLNKWLKMGFVATMASALGLLAIAYFIHAGMFKSI